MQKHVLFSNFQIYAFKSNLKNCDRHGLIILPASTPDYATYPKKGSKAFISKPFDLSVTVILDCFVLNQQQF